MHELPMQKAAASEKQTDNVDVRMSRPESVLVSPVLSLQWTQSCGYRLPEIGIRECAT